VKKLNIISGIILLLIIFIAITANLDMMSPAVGEKLKGLKMLDCPLLMSLQLFEIVK
jgi:hypothetical protein